MFTGLLGNAVIRVEGRVTVVHKFDDQQFATLAKLLGADSTAINEVTQGLKKSGDNLTEAIAEYTPTT